MKTNVLKLETMFKNVLIFGAGIFVARWYYLQNGTKESEAIDKIRNNLHDFIKGISPEAKDVEIADKVKEITDV